MNKLETRNYDQLRFSLKDGSVIFKSEIQIITVGKRMVKKRREMMHAECTTLVNVMALDDIELNTF